MQNDRVLTETILYWRGASDGRSVAEVLRNAQSETPLFYWVDLSPVFQELGKFGRPKHFQGLGRGECPNSSLDTYCLEEARLFWEDRSLHVLAQDQSGCRWFECTDTDPKDPLWCEERVLASKPEEIICRKDYSSFGIGESEPVGKIQVIEFWKGSSLLTWRLTSIEYGEGNGER